MTEKRTAYKEFFSALRTIELCNEWDRWVEEIPFIQWPHNWQVKAIPPVRGAVIRYLITTPYLGGKRVSVFLDCYDQLGCVGEPYWEVYPYNGDVARFAMADTKGLLNAIRISLMQLRRKP